MWFFIYFFCETFWLLSFSSVYHIIFLLCLLFNFHLILSSFPKILSPQGQELSLLLSLMRFQGLSSAYHIWVAKDYYEVLVKVKKRKNAGDIWWRKKQNKYLSAVPKYRYLRKGFSELRILHFVEKRKHI